MWEEARWPGEIFTLVQRVVIIQMKMKHYVTYKYLELFQYFTFSISKYIVPFGKNAIAVFILMLFPLLSCHS